MHASHIPRVIATVLVALVLAGCMTGFDLGPPPGGRRLVISVDNRRSARPAVVQVGGAGEQPGPAVGRAVPNMVPPSSAADVVFDVPPGNAWMIWVNRQAIVSSGDVPLGAAGKTPITIDVSGDGSVSAGTSTNLPGWFGD